MLLEKKTKRDRCLRIADRKFDKPSAYKSGAVVRCRQGKIWKELKEGKYDDTSNFDLVKQNLFNIKKLVDKGILFVTKPGDGKGGVEEPNWEGDASIITLYNMSNAEPWMKEAVKNPIPQAIPYIQKDQSKLLYNGKYNQILWSIEKKGLKPEDFYLSLKEQLDDIWKDIKEGSDEEAWELVGQKDLNISKVINNAGFKNDEESVNRLIPIIDNTPETTISPSQISNLKNFNNKPGEESLIKDMISVSKSPDSRQEYADYMKKRDEKENRNRGYNPVQNYDNVVKGNYEPPVLININGTLYVIGGRTRLYAGLAANKSMKVKILNTSQLKEILKEDESLRKWFKRKGAPGKTGGWVDCNSPIRKDGEIVGYKPCGRQKGEERAKYPSCRPTAARCKDEGKGKTWGKTK